MFSVTNTANSTLKYAAYSFFQNNGSQLYIQRVVNTDAKNGATIIYGAAGTGSVTTTATIQSLTNTGATITLSSGHPILSATTTNAVVVISGVTGTAATAGINNTWTLNSITNSTTFNITASGAVATTAYNYQTASKITVTAYDPGTKTNQRGIVVTAKDAGDWGQNLFVTAVPSSNAAYFDLLVYYKTGVTSPSTLINSNPIYVDRIPYLSLDPTDPYYAPNRVNSQWITVTATNVAGTGTVAMPTYIQDSTTKALSSGPINIGNGTLDAPNTNSCATSVVATAGLLAASTTLVAQQLDAIPAALTINYPQAVDTTTVNALLSYAYTRGDAFVVIDSTNTTSITDQTNLATSFSSSYGAFGALYYPWITISDPASKSNGTINVAPGAAVAAIYSVTDSSRGVFKAPAGMSAQVKGVGLSYSLTNDDFNTVNSASKPVNIIRYVPGAQFCIMGAKTLSSSLSDNYVPVRRTLNYLRRSLTNVTSKFVFEPNGPITWANVASSVETFLYNFWQKGGLLGATPQQAYYIKCDSTTNTPSAQAAGELRVEIGVALQRPAEYIIIKLGQFQGGTNVTTSV